MPPHRAAELLGVDEHELAEQVRRGDHEWIDVAGFAFVRPALVSRLTSLVEHEQRI